MKYEVWKDEEDGSYTVATPQHIINMKNLGRINALFTNKVLDIEADSWEDAMQQYYDFAGLGTYKPMEKEPCTK